MSGEVLALYQRDTQSLYVHKINSNDNERNNDSRSGNNNNHNDVHISQKYS